jgi:hypothetical protein
LAGEIGHRPVGDVRLIAIFGFDARLRDGIFQIFPELGA